MERFFLPCLKVLSFFSKKLRAQIANRNFSQAQLINLARERSNKEFGAVFFCSSAGEFEQARPLISELVRRKWFVHIFFFSASGVDFCKHRKETISYSLAPIDSIFSWGKVFSALRPDLSFVVRHEFWPAFLETSSRWGKAILINFTVTNSSSISLSLKRLLMGFFARIFVVNAKDENTVKEKWRMANTYLSGDTKYDRVMERKETAENSELIRKLRSIFSGKKVFIGGSIYLADIPLLLDVLQKFDGSMVLIPHSLDDQNITALQKELSRNQISSQCISNFDEKISERVVILKAMGILAELYGIGSAAYVGGAAHNKVHNVLEPMIWGLPVAFGPKYQNSSEATLAVQEHVATVVQTSEEMTAWLEKVSRSGSQAAVLDFVHGYVGASAKILNSSLELLKDQLKN